MTFLSFFRYWYYVVIIALASSCGVLYYLNNAKEESIKSLAGDLSKVQTELSTCAGINKANTEEITKLRIAEGDARTIAEQTRKDIKLLNATLQSRILEIANASDNGPIPGVLQRTLVSVRARIRAEAAGSNSESSTGDSQ